MAKGAERVVMELLFEKFRQSKPKRLRTSRKRLGVKVMISALVASMYLLGSIAAEADGPSAPSSGLTERGINLSFYDYLGLSDQYIADQAQAYALFVKSLDANWVTINIPLWTNSVTASRVYAGSDPLSSSHAVTPSPARVAMVVDAMHAEHLSVRLRPFINEGDLALSGHWRGQLEPRRMGKWFRTYNHSIAPFLAIAYTHDAESFAIASELQSLSANPRWAKVIASAHQVFSGTIAWDALSSDGPDGTWSPHPGAKIGLDAYPSIDVPNSVPASVLVGGFNHWLNLNPLPRQASSIVLQEVGIVAQGGRTYRHPWKWRDLSLPFRPDVQRKWFKAACIFAKANGLRGLSFNSLFLTSPIPNGDDPTHPEAFQAGSIAAIRTCYSP